MRPGERALRYSETAIRSSASFMPLRRMPAACACSPEIEAQSSPPEAGKRLPRGLDHVIVHVASVERMGMAKDRISANPPLLKQSLDSYLCRPQLVS